MNISVISRNIGVALVCNALFMFICTVVAALYDFDSAFSPLLLSGIITITVGLFPLIFVKANREIDIKNGFIIIVLSWLLCCLFGMLPYVLWGGEFNLVNAWFESVSGYTTTGATILNNIEALPHSLLLWRSSTHFLGGIGIVIFYSRIKTVFSIHNLLFKGSFSPKVLPELFGYDYMPLVNGSVELDGSVSFLKGGLNYCDQITTVSKTYAEEIKTPQYGEGLDGFLRSKSYYLMGIVNGIDYEEFNKMIKKEYKKQ